VFTVALTLKDVFDIGMKLQLIMECFERISISDGFVGVNQYYCRFATVYNAAKVIKT
jgi:hypothetical protein